MLIYYLGGALFYSVICGLITAAIGSAKRHSALGFFFVGFFFSLIGIFVAAIMEPNDSPRPYGATLRTETKPARNPGWYDDPWNVAQLRWHDGENWSETVTTYADLQQGRQQTPPAAPPVGAQQ